MRRVTKAKAAAMEANGKMPSRRKATKNSSFAEGEAEEKVAVKEGPAVSSVPKNGNSLVDGNESDEVESYEVESILASRVRHGKQQFKIRWKGYGPADDTWEDEENVDSPDLIAAFLKLSPKDEKVTKTAAKKPAQKRSGSSTPKTKPAKKVKTDVKDEIDDTEYEVSKILDYVELKDGTRQFLVRWKGFSSKENTWEPEAHLNCPELIEKYLALEKKKDDSQRETREVRQQVNKYNPELTKRRSHRSSTIKSGHGGSLDDSVDSTTYIYQQQGNSPFSNSSVDKYRISPWGNRGSYSCSSSSSSSLGVNNSWYSKISSSCSLM